MPVIVGGPNGWPRQMDPCCDSGRTGH